MAAGAQQLRLMHALLAIGDSLLKQCVTVRTLSEATDPSLPDLNPSLPDLPDTYPYPIPDSLSFSLSGGGALPLRLV